MHVNKEHGKNYLNKEKPPYKVLNMLTICLEAPPYSKFSALHASRLVFLEDDMNVFQISHRAWSYYHPSWNGPPWLNHKKILDHDWEQNLEN